jgi:hypothetical protein
MNNRKRTSDRNIQTVKYYRYEMRDGKKVRAEQIVNKQKQVRHAPGFADTDTKGSDTKGKPVVYFDMAITYIGGGELEGIVDPDSVNVIVHASNRATLVRKAKRELTEKDGFICPVINLPKPSVRIEGVVL